MKYKVKFSLYGKKMQTTVEADSKERAEYLIRGKVKFHSIIETLKVKNKSIFEQLKNITKS